MPRCCSGGTCACVVQQGPHISVTGTGASQDPFVISGDTDLTTISNTNFALSLQGAGTTVDPWVLQVDYNTTAKLDGIPDVNAPAPTNGQVLGWDSATSKWTARAPTTAASGSVHTDPSLVGDGSVGTPIGVVGDGTRYIGTTSLGVGLTDQGLNNAVLHYANAAVRGTDLAHAIHVNALSMLDDSPGVQWYWTGTQWAPVFNGISRDYGTGEFMAMSGDFNPAGFTEMMIRQVSATTNADGSFEILSSADLGPASGVLSCTFQETGIVPFKTMVTQGGDSVIGVAYRLDDGTTLGAQLVTGTAVAWLY